MIGLVATPIADDAAALAMAGKGEQASEQTLTAWIPRDRGLTMTVSQTFLDGSRGAASGRVNAEDGAVLVIHNQGARKFILIDGPGRPANQAGDFPPFPRPWLTPRRED